MLRRIYYPERAASTLEYVALLTLVAGLATAVLAWGLPTLPNQVNASVSNSICNILNLGDCEEPGSTEVADDDEGDGSGSGTGDSGDTSDDTGLDGVDDGSGSGEDTGAENNDPDADDPGVDDSDADGSDPADGDFVLFDPELAEELQEAEDELADAEDALAEAEAGDDELLDELLELLWEITGGADIERCFTEGDIGSCIMAAIGLIPWGKLLKVASKIPKMWRLFDRWRDARRLRNTRRADVDDARARQNQAREACGLTSFVPGTPVLMADGSYLPIEDIELGDEVWAFDPHTGEEGQREVTALLGNDGEKTLVEVTVTGTGGDTDTVVATDSHPFWAPERAEWIDAIDLEPGTWLRTSSGTWVQVSAVNSWDAPNQQVHNLTVAGIHTYYVGVGEDSLLVHNQAGGTSPCNLPGPGDKPRKVANSNMDHAAQRAEQRLDFPDKKSAREALQNLGKDIERNGFPPGTRPDPDHADRVFVPFGNDGYAVYQIKPNGNAVLKTVLNRRD